MDYSEMRVKYLIFNFRYPTYMAMQIGLFIVWILLGIVGLAFMGSDNWVLANAHWLCPAIAIAEAIEAAVAIYFAKKKWELENS
ncbi:hypothetical protein Pan97_36740 [Bremerella volcania]|uniref:Uncharacterized protein n=1 Tax=Bremerella volcania TaxID=2527984 RepID=A0A518CBL3_9BACT|nr:hypothetical protein [Bremerella volcania]QDU76621.1 hypothetical protein Pan97_36740 [Bremerella volcania]